MSLNDNDRKEIVDFRKKYYGRLDSKIQGVEFTKSGDYQDRPAIIGNESGLLQLALLLLEVVSDKNENQESRRDL
jgi:hypothetical protein